MATYGSSVTPAAVVPLADATINGTAANTSAKNSLEIEERNNMIFLSALLFAIAAGNLIVILSTVLSKPGLKSRMNFFILNLAIADLLVGASILTTLVTRLVEVWYAGDAMCKSVVYLKNVVMYASNYVLVALSIDRLDAIARPMKFLGSGLRAKLLIGSAWCLSLVFALPAVIFSHVGTFRRGVTECRLNLPEPRHWQMYITIVFVVVFVIPALIIVLCYSLIVAVIWRKSTLTPVVVERPNGTSEFNASASQNNDSHRRLLSNWSLRRQNQQQQPIHPSTSERANNRNRSEFRTRSAVNKPLLSSVSSVNSSFYSHIQGNVRMSQGVIPQAKVKTIKMTFVIVLAFVMCWSPYFVYNLLSVYKVLPPSRGLLAMFMQSLGHMNSIANPIIYCLFSIRLQRNTRRVLNQPSLSRLYHRIVECCCCWNCGGNQENLDRTGSSNVALYMPTYQLQQLWRPTPGAAAAREESAGYGNRQDCDTGNKSSDTAVIEVSPATVASTTGLSDTKVRGVEVLLPRSWKVSMNNRRRSGPAVCDCSSAMNKTDRAQISTAKHYDHSC